MKKYRHKTTGKEAEQASTGNAYKTKKYDGSYDIIPSWVIEGSSDWEEAAEKGYEILSFVCIDGTDSSVPEGTLISQKSYGWRTEGCAAVYTLDYLLSCRKYAIHSVKRLSDGETFADGDRLSDFGLVFTIAGIVVAGSWSGGIYFICNEGGLIGIAQAEKCARELLFTTEDGIEIYEGDSFAFVHDSYIISVVKACSGTHLFKDYKRFSTKEKAEEYVLENKPMFSVLEIVAYVSKNPLLSEDVKAYLHFIELSKDKLGRKQIRI